MWILSENSIFSKTRRYSYVGPLGTTDLEYESHDQEILSFGQFLSQTENFQ
jgi:hypothetical protein